MISWFSVAAWLLSWLICATSVFTVVFSTLLGPLSPVEIELNCCTSVCALDRTVSRLAVLVGSEESAVRLVKNEDMLLARLVPVLGNRSSIWSSAFTCDVALLCAEVCDWICDVSN
jgi:hypothetical protein